MVANYIPTGKRIRRMDASHPPFVYAITIASSRPTVEIPNAVGCDLGSCAANYKTVPDLKFSRKPRLFRRNVCPYVNSEGGYVGCA